MQYKIHMLMGILFFTLGCYSAQQRQIDTIVGLEDEILEKSKLLKDLDDSIRQHSQEIFVKLCINEQEKDNFEQKRVYLQQNVDPAKIKNLQAVLEKELFSTINMAVQDHAAEVEKVAILKDEVLKYLVEENELTRIAANYYEQLAALGKNALVEKETVHKKLQRINTYLENYCKTAFLVGLAGALTFVITTAPFAVYNTVFK